VFLHPQAAYAVVGAFDVCLDEPGGC
jgi:hypothetical protein